MIRLQADNFIHIEFKRIKSCHYSFHDQLLKIDVDSSASFLMKAFDHVVQVKQISFDWCSDGLPQVKDAVHEAMRSGDDAVFKLGLLLRAEEEAFNPFLPSWMKHVEKQLNFPSENMIYLVAGARHAPGEQWLNPYNKRVTMVAMSSDAEKQCWHKASYLFTEPVEAVALWLMADGDNTGSRFSVRVKNLEIK